MSSTEADSSISAETQLLGGVEEQEGRKPLLEGEGDLRDAVAWAHGLQTAEARRWALGVVQGEVQRLQLLDAPDLLVLRMRMRESACADAVGVEDACARIVERLAAGVAAGEAVEGWSGEALDAAIPEVVLRAVGGCSVQETLRLVQFSTRLPLVSSSCRLVAALLEQLTQRQLLRSEQALHLWAHAKYYADHASCRQLQPHAHALLEHYRRYVELPDRSAIQRLHRDNWHLQAIATDFLAFYFNGQLHRSQHLLAAAKAVARYLAIGRVLR